MLSTRWDGDDDNGTGQRSEFGIRHLGPADLRFIEEELLNLEGFRMEMRVIVFGEGMVECSVLNRWIIVGYKAVYT